MYKKNLAMRAGVVMMAGALTFGSMPINVFADVNITTEESSQSVVFNFSHFNDDTGMVENSPVSISAKVMIAGVSHYLNSSYISCASSWDSGTIDVSSDAFGASTLYTDPVTGEWHNLYVFNGKSYKITGSSAIFDGNTELTNNGDFNFSFETKPLNYTADSKIEITYEVEEVVNETSKDISVSVDEDAWKYNLYGTWKNLNIKVNDSMYALSKDSSTEAITFNNGDTVKIFAGDSYELWSGTISIDMGSVSISGNKPSGLVWNSTLSYENGGLVFMKLADTTWGGVNAGFYNNVFYSYDFTAKADDDSPISGISITDNTSIPYVDPILSELESGKTYTWGTDNSYTFTRNTGGAIDDGVGVMTCKTDANGFADMLFPLESIIGDGDFGSDVFMSSNLDSRLQSATSDYTESGYVYSNNGLVDIDTENVDADGKKFQATLGSLGVSTSLTPKSNNVVLGNSYSLTQVAYGTDSVILKDNFGNEIGTVTMSVDSMDNLVKVDNDYYLSGSALTGNVIPKAEITMADGVTDWTVSAEYEAGEDTGTFHITATKTNKADISVYDVYGAEVVDGVVDTSEAKTVARLEEAYIEPNSSIELANKGVQTIDETVYTPIVGDDLVVQTKSRAITSRLDVVEADKVDVTIEPNNSYAVYFYYQAPKEAPKTYNLKVIDVYGDEEVERESKVVPTGYEYSYGKNEKDDWKVTGTASYSGTVTEDTTIYFYYEKPAVTETVTIKVYDHFGEGVEERVSKTVDKGTSYNYSSITKDDWIPTGTQNYSGTANEDVELHFYYNQPAKPDQYKITVVDVFIMNSIAGNVQNITDGEVKEDGIYTYISEDTVDYTSANVIPERKISQVRDSRTVDSGYAYNYDALSTSDWNVVGVSNQSGTVDKDIVLYFYYNQIDTDNPVPVIPSVPDTPDEDVPNIPEITPSQPSEPKTGQTDSIFGALSLASILAFLTAWKKRRK